MNSLGNFQLQITKKNPINEKNPIQVELFDDQPQSLYLILAPFYFD